MNRTIRELHGDFAYILSSTFYHRCTESFKNLIFYFLDIAVFILQTQFLDTNFTEKKSSMNESLCSMYSSNKPRRRLSHNFETK